MNDHTLDASVRVDLNGNVQPNAKRYEQALGSMSRNGSRHLNKLQRTTAYLDTTMSRLGNRWLGLATGGSIVAAGKKVLDFDATLTRMQTSARLSDEQIASLKQQLLEISNSKDVRVPIDELTAAVAQFLDKTGDVDYATEQMHNFGIMMQGLGVEAQGAGLLMAQFWEDGIKDPKAVTDTLDRLFAQFSRGSVSVKDIARVSAELFSAVESKGPAAIAEIGALAQIYAKTAGNADKAQTAIVGTVRALNNAKSAAKLDSALKREGLAPIREANGMIRSLPQLLLDITKVANNSIPILSTVFDTEALNGLKSLVDPKNKALLLDMINGTVEQNLTLDASSKNAKTASAAMNSLFNAGRRFADLNLSGPIQNLADSIDKLSDAELVEMMETAKDVTLAVGGIILGLKAMNAGTNILAKTQAKGTNPLGNAVSGMTPVPVFVVNSMTGGLGGADLPGGKGSPAGNTKPGKLGKIAKLGSLGLLGSSAALSLAGAGAIGYGIGSLINPFIEGTAFTDWMGATVARTLASFGNEEAQRAVVKSGDAHPIYGRHYAGQEEQQAQLKQEQQRITVELELTSEASKALKPKETRKAENSAVDLEVSGSMGAF